MTERSAGHAHQDPMNPDPLPSLPLQTLRVASSYERGVPIYWQADSTGVLVAAVKAYIQWAAGKGPAPNAEQLEHVRRYCAYFIDAPCWSRWTRESKEIAADFAELRTRIRTVGSPEGLRRWLVESADAGLDPL